MSLPLHHASDAELVALARDGDRIAFGLLYLRHHAAAWRLASVISGFSDDAELAVMAAFTDVFAAPGTDDLFRARLLACVRRAGRERARRRASLPRWPDGSMRAALTALSEPRRTALWLTDIEAMTPAEVGAVLGMDARSAGQAADDARRWVAAVSRESLALAAPPPPLLGGECQRHWLTHWAPPRRRVLLAAAG